VCYEERKRNFIALKRIYDIASKAVHGQNVKFNQINEKIFADAYALCRDGILKRLEEGKNINWDDLVLGKLDP